MKILIDPEYYSISKSKRDKTYIYVFGDNLQRRGKGGQAVIRYCSNSIGVATKKSPSMDKESFFSDEFYQLHALQSDVFNVYKMFIDPKYEGYTLIFPLNGLGTGLSQLPSKSPDIYTTLCYLLYKYFNIFTDTNSGRLSIHKNG